MFKACYTGQAEYLVTIWIKNLVTSWQHILLPHTHTRTHTHTHAHTHTHTHIYISLNARTGGTRNKFRELIGMLVRNQGLSLKQAGKLCVLC